MRASEPPAAPAADPSPPPAPGVPAAQGPLSAPPSSTPPGQAPSALAVASPPEHPPVPSPASGSPSALPPLRVQSSPRSSLPSRLPLPRSRTPFPLPSRITQRLPPLDGGPLPGPHHPEVVLVLRPSPAGRAPLALIVALGVELLLLAAGARAAHTLLLPTLA
ncbi:putative basic proline-rich protein-like [Iris pallida]|uniref:Basic proline-rich protein-like n=1 Tax=Iris pallida TaxID=29817 RepID=A0AAX6HNC7_IRIPA|nr:putative basic proline-rich protein-like [Iris pallida]